MNLIVGTAGWAIPRCEVTQFPSDGTSLQRYAQRLQGVEINSSFYRSHRISTWARWSASVPAHFRFSVKIPKAITHVAKLIDVDEAVAQFCAEIAGMGSKLSVLLVQLPPKLAFDETVSRKFFRKLQTSSGAQLVCEPRHLSWFTNRADEMLYDMKVARVAADPSLCESAGYPGGWRHFRYRRLHGSPRMYRSAYGEAALKEYATQICAELAEHIPSWCIFDNTASSAALGDALALQAALARADSIQSQSAA